METRQIIAYALIATLVLAGVFVGKHLARSRRRKQDLWRGRQRRSDNADHL